MKAKPTKWKQLIIYLAAEKTGLFFTFIIVLVLVLILALRVNISWDGDGFKLEMRNLDNKIIKR
jgi:hypothetical protein